MLGNHYTDIYFLQKQYHKTIQTILGRPHLFVKEKRVSSVNRLKPCGSSRHVFEIYTIASSSTVRNTSQANDLCSAYASIKIKRLYELRGMKV